MPFGPQCTVCGRLYPVRAAMVSASITFTIFGFRGIGLGINNVNARRPYPRHYQVTALRVRVRGIGAKTSAAGVPAEVMQFITDIGHVHLSDEFAVGRRRWIYVHHANGISPARVGGIQQRHECVLFRWRLTG